MSTAPRTGRLLFGAAVLVGLLALTGLHPYDFGTWVLEVFPVMIVLPILFMSYRRFPLTDMLYCLIFAHAVVLMVGGAYTYARVPFGFYLEQLFHLSRNPYDRIGHFFQGLVPAIAAREILLRGQYIKPGKMMAFIVLCIVMAISATYELIEWAAAVAFGQGAEAFLGTQGDPWDTQSDMLLALIGGSTAIALLSRWHDRQMKRLG